MRLSIVSPAPGYPGTSGVLAVYCRGLCRQTSLPAGNMYGVVAVARVQTSLLGGDHVRACGGGSKRKRPGRVGTMYGVAAVARWCSFGPGI